MKNWYEKGGILQYWITSDIGSGTKIDKCVYEWFCHAQSNQILVSELMSKSKALKGCWASRNKKISKHLTDG